MRSGGLDTPFNAAAGVRWGIRLFALGAALWAAPPGRADETFQRARDLIQQDRHEQAFAVLLQIPGAEHIAARLARQKAPEYLRLADGLKPPLPGPGPRAVRGDLLLASGNRAGALVCYREAAALLAAALPGPAPVPYVVEPPARTESDGLFGGYGGPVGPFALGPGSHRDNWLIRRFIALEAWEDAERELARVWTLHRAHTTPYVRAVLPIPGATNLPSRIVVRPCGFDGKGLQFAVDYAFFLRQRGRTNEALRLLLEPLQAMDMDRNPAQPRTEALAADGPAPYPERPAADLDSRLRGFWPGAPAGIARKEYVRLVAGEFVQAGQVALLERSLQERIGAGRNGARRVLARVRVHQGRAAEALALELACVDEGRFGELSAAVRRGLAFEDAASLAEAAAEYERALGLPLEALDLPDPDEETVDQQLMSQAMPIFRHGLGRQTDRAGLHRELFGRLQRLYGALGDARRANETALRRFESDPAQLEDFAAVEQAVSRFRAAGEAERIAAWLRAQAEAAAPAARANLLWFLDDRAGVMRALAAIPPDRPGGSRFAAWKERFRAVGSADYEALLVALVAANPADAQMRLELLDARGVREGDEAIGALELLLAGDALPAFVRGKGAVNRTQFRNYFDLATRLMRLYERKGGSEAKLIALGFRVLEGEKPFQYDAARLAAYRPDWNDGFSAFADAPPPFDILNCFSVFFAHLRDPADIARAAALAEATGSLPLINQARRLRSGPGAARLAPDAGHELPFEAVDVRTLGCPTGVTLLVNRDDVRAIAPGARWPRAGAAEPGCVWVGTSWGLVRYRTGAASPRRLEIVQIPLQAGVTTFAATPAGLFAGTRDGLYRIDGPESDSPALARIPVEAADGRQRDRVERHVSRSGATREERIHEAFRVTQLLWWSHALWVCSTDAAYRYEPASRAVSCFGNLGGGLFEGRGRLWAPRAVYDPAAAEFIPIEADFKYWQLIGATPSAVWASVFIDERVGFRPALLAESVMTLHALPIAGAGRAASVRSGGFGLLGELDGQTWLGASNPDILAVYVPGSGELAERAKAPDGAPWLRGQPGPALAAAGLNLSGDRGPALSAVPLGAGRLLIGNAIVREWAEDNLGYDDNKGMSHHVQDLEGGLFVVDPEARTWAKLDTHSGQLTDFYVKRLVRDGRRLYVCTNGGVTILALPDGSVIGRLTLSDGLPSNKIEDAARIGDRLYLACELGDEGGGLAVQDLRTGLIQTLTMADGLTCNKVKQLRVEGDALSIGYGTVYAPRAHFSPLEKSVPAPLDEAVKRRWEPTREFDESVRTFRGSVLRVGTGRFEDGADVLPASYPPELRESPLPVLGGHALCREELPDGGAVFIGGTHGLLMLAPGMSTNIVAVEWPREEVTPQRSRRQALLEEAAGRPMDLAGPGQVEAALVDANPFYRARAAAALLGKDEALAAHVPALIGLLDDPELRVRSTALYLLTRVSADEAVVEAFRRRTADRDPHIRAVAVVALCRCGRVPELPLLRQVMANGDRFGNFPFGPSSSVGVAANREQLVSALAPHARAGVFGLLLEDPPAVSDYEPHVAVLKKLGESLCRDTNAVPVLLAAHNRRGMERQVDFAQAVFRYAGPPVLPALHAALASPDRIVRSNAARACGAIGDPASIPHLIGALDLESGLSRASIVKALGMLKADGALPRLVSLYAEARTDEQRRRGSGFLAAQSAAQAQAQYESIANLDALAGDWTELQAAAVPAPLDPREDEELLSPELILQAVAAIGPARAQEFYRGLAGLKDAAGRVEAAVRLAEGSAAELPANLPVLKSLLADPGQEVRLEAAVSLLILGESVAEPPVLEWLERGDRWQKVRTVRALQRVPDGVRLAFARRPLEAIAADAAADEQLRKQASALLERIGDGT